MTHLLRVLVCMRARACPRECSLSFGDMIDGVILIRYARLDVCESVRLWLCTCFVRTPETYWLMEHLTAERSLNARYL